MRSKASPQQWTVAIFLTQSSVPTLFLVRHTQKTKPNINRDQMCLLLRHRNHTAGGEMGISSECHVSLTPVPKPAYLLQKAKQPLNGWERKNNQSQLGCGRNSGTHDEAGAGMIAIHAMSPF